MKLCLYTLITKMSSKMVIDVAIDSETFEPSVCYIYIGVTGSQKRQTKTIAVIALYSNKQHSRKKKRKRSKQTILQKRLAWQLQSRHTEQSKLAWICRLTAQNVNALQNECVKIVLLKFSWCIDRCMWLTGEWARESEGLQWVVETGVLSWLWGSLWKAQPGSPAWHCFSVLA